MCIWHHDNEMLNALVASNLFVLLFS
jgi:hypothetical protein